MSKKRQRELQREREKLAAKRPLTWKDWLWTGSLLLLTLGITLWGAAVAVTALPEGRTWSNLYPDAMEAMAELEGKNEGVLGWSIEREGGGLALMLTVSRQATEEEVEAWKRYFLGTVKNTVGLIQEYEYRIEAVIE